ncbi:MAG: hypothetical protein H0U89_05715 [Acidimicrobiia bacterium]|nr:hypothetical protein [Acidimicrobiia bacterium]
MSDESAREVYRALREAQNRYTYFLLAAAAAAISVALNQTETATLRAAHAPLGAAVLSWGVSFFCGCRNLVYVSSSLYANAELLRVQGGQHPGVGQDRELMGAASDGIRAALETNSNRANRNGHWQFRFLVVGALLYIGWHVGQMYLRTWP